MKTKCEEYTMEYIQNETQTQTYKYRHTNTDTQSQTQKTRIGDLIRSF